MEFQYSLYGVGAWLQYDVSFNAMIFILQFNDILFLYYFRTSKVQQTRSYISSFYDEDNPFGFSVFALYTEGYCKT